MRELHARRPRSRFVQRTSAITRSPANSLWLLDFTTPRRSPSFRTARNRLSLERSILRAKLKTMALIVVLLAQGRGSLRGQFTTTNFFNWETAPVHPLALSPDRRRLVLCNLPDNRLEVFDVTAGKPIAL